MLTDWIKFSRVSIEWADRLYPQGLDWHLHPGINAVVGGTGLGKTTLVYAMQFAVFGKLVVNTSERIEKEFFKGRLTKRSGQQLEKKPPVIRVEFTAGGTKFKLTRLLLSGTLKDVTCDGVPLKSAQFEKVLAAKVGLKDDFHGLVRLQSHLFFFGEGRYLLAWENQLQHELISLMMSDHATYLRLGQQWEEAESADSAARNLSAQAVRMERDLEEMRKQESKVDELRQKVDGDQLAASQRQREQNVALIQQRLASELRQETAITAKIERAHRDFHRNLSQLEAVENSDLDDTLLAAALADPTVASIRQALGEFYRDPSMRGCPCCGRPGIATQAVRLAETAAESARTGNCVVCSKDLPAGDARPVAIRREKTAADDDAATLRTLLFQQEQVRSRIAELRTEESNALQALAEIREAALKYAAEHPTSAAETMQITIRHMRDREKKAKKKRDEFLAKLGKELAKTNTVFEQNQAKIAEAFTKYAALYLDEPCDVQFLSAKEIPGKRGPQVKAPHAAFYPVVSGETRPSAQALSDAQRSFIDLAFRMAVIEVWHQSTKRTVTMIIETPEGAVDIAYMERVATMMRTFGEQGHTLLISTNLNNDIFLPEVMSRWPKKERRTHILNLLEEGNPRKVQIKGTPRFDVILALVDSHPVAR